MQCSGLLCLIRLYAFWRLHTPRPSSFWDVRTHFSLPISDPCGLSNPHDTVKSWITNWIELFLYWTLQCTVWAIIRLRISCTRLPTTRKEPRIMIRVPHVRRGWLRAGRPTLISAYPCLFQKLVGYPLEPQKIVIHISRLNSKLLNKY